MPREASSLVGPQHTRPTEADHGVEQATVLWATSPTYSRPQFVAAWPEGLVDAWHERYYDERALAMAEYGEDDGPWTFWVSVEPVTRPRCVHAFQHHPESEDVGICSHCGAEELTEETSR